jgi:hypothetical protein
MSSALVAKAAEAKEQEHRGKGCAKYCSEDKNKRAMAFLFEEYKCIGSNGYNCGCMAATATQKRRWQRQRQR